MGGRRGVQHAACAGDASSRSAGSRGSIAADPSQCTTPRNCSATGHCADDVMATLRAAKPGASVLRESTLYAELLDGSDLDDGGFMRDVRSTRTGLVALWFLQAWLLDVACCCLFITSRRADSNGNLSSSGPMGCDLWHCGVCVVQRDKWSQSSSRTARCVICNMVAQAE